VYNKHVLIMLQIVQKLNSQQENLHFNIEKITKISVKVNKYHKNSAWQKLEHLTPLPRQQDAGTSCGTKQPKSLQICN